LCGGARKALLFRGQLASNETHLERRFVGAGDGQLPQIGREIARDVAITSKKA
jgi:hypothetical protein